jgi:hypothetical protein
MNDRLRFDLSGLARLCRWALGLVVAAELANAANNIFFLSFLNKVETGDVDYALADWIDQISLIIGIGYMVAFVGTMIISAVWIYRASWNARQIQPLAERITPGWAVGWFAVPLANYFMPYKAMKQCWQSSHDPTGDIEGQVPSLFGWWWTAWVLASLTGNVVMRLHAKAETISELRTAYTVELVTAPFTLVSAVFFARVIMGITEAQRDRTPALAMSARLPVICGQEPDQNGDSKS